MFNKLGKFYFLFYLSIFKIEKIEKKKREKLRLNAAPIQIPIGLEGEHEGVVDIIDKIAIYFEGPKG